MRRYRTGAAIGAIVAAVSCAAPGAANATTLFSNITGQPTVVGSESLNSSFWVARQFSPTTTGAANLISFWVQCDVGGSCGLNSGSTNGTIEIYSDSGGHPGASLGPAATFAAAPALGGTPNCAVMSSPPTLTVGTQYWAVMKTAGSDFVSWHYQDSGAGTVDDSTTSGASWTTLSGGDLSLRIDTGTSCGAHMLPNPTAGTTIGGMFGHPHTFNTITMGNDGLAALNLTSYTITETDSTGQTPFSLLNGQPDGMPPGTTQPQTSQVFPGGTEILYTACAGSTQENHYTATLTINTNDGSISWPLSCYVDNTPPKITISTTPTTPNGSNGWFTTNPVDVGVIADDGVNGSGTNNVTCTNNGVQVVNVPASGASFNATTEGDNNVSCTASDVAGNVTPNPTTAVVKIDSLPPVITPGVTPPPNAAGWNNSATTISFTCADQIPASGIYSGIDTNTVGGGGNYTTETPKAGTVVSNTGTCTDKAGNTGASSSVTLKIDETPPTSTSVSGGPPARTNSTSASFTLSGTDALSGVAGFQCSLDGATPTSCTSPKSYSNLAPGAHTFMAQAIDAAGNIDPTGASTSWFVDTTPPTVVFDSPAANATVDPSGQISFHATDTGDNSDSFLYSCQLDGGTPSTCTSPYSYSNLTSAGNPHTLKVTATDLATNASSTSLNFNIKAMPSISTTQQPSSAVVESQVADKATVSGGNSPTGTVTFNLYDNPNGTGTPLFTDANELLSNGSATSTGFTTTATGTDYWVATYNGDSNNLSVSSSDSAEPVTINAASPSINTSQQPASAAAGSPIADKATVSGGDSPTGTVTFNLYDNANGTGTPLFTDANEPLSNGSATSKGYMTTATGTDYWVATYNGDSNNSPVSSGTAAEPVTIVQASPAISTSQQPSTAAVGSPIADKATVSGGDSPGGTVTFNLYDNPNGTGTPLFTDTETLSNGSATSNGYTTTATGTDYWVATYNGDSNNNPVSSGAAAEPVTIIAGGGGGGKSSPSLTVGAPPSGSPGTEIDAAAITGLLSGGASPTGTITFKVFGPQPTAPSDCSGGANVGTATVSANGTYSSSAGFTPSSPGDYWWYASYDGDSKNNGANSGCGASMTETIVGKATPSLSVGAPSSGTAGTEIDAASITAQLSGGDPPTGTITFKVFGPQSTAPSDCSGGTPVGTATVSGDGAYDPLAGFTPPSAGDYWWYASYGGDSNDNSTTSTCGAGMVETVVAAQVVLSHLQISPHTFVLIGRLVGGRCVPQTTTNSKDPRCTRPIRLTAGYELNIPAQVVITIAHELPGRLVSGHCEVPTPQNSQDPGCTRLVALPGSLTENGGQGTNSFTFEGLTGGHTFGPGSYQLTATPSANGQAGTPRTTTFTITA